MLFVVPLGGGYVYCAASTQLGIEKLWLVNETNDITVARLLTFGLVSLISPSPRALNSALGVCRISWSVYRVTNLTAAQWKWTTTSILLSERLTR